MVRHNGAIRWGFLMDTGAPQSAVGESTLEQFIVMCKLRKFVIYEPFKTSISGVGAGSASVEHKVKVPVGIDTGKETFLSSYYHAQVLKGCGSDVPPLYGLEGMLAAGGIFDLRVQETPGVYKYKTNAGEFVLYYVHGHLILPADWGGSKDIPSLEHFLEDPEGVGVFYNDADVSIIEPVVSEVVAVLPVSLCLPKECDQNFTHLVSGSEEVDSLIQCTDIAPSKGVENFNFLY
jgi:hypothetical protein